MYIAKWAHMKLTAQHFRRTVSKSAMLAKLLQSIGKLGQLHNNCEKYGDLSCFAVNFSHHITGQDRPMILVAVDDQYHWQVIYCGGTKSLENKLRC